MRKDRKLKWWICCLSQDIPFLIVDFNYGEEKYKPVSKSFILENHASISILSLHSPIYLSCSQLYSEWDKAYSCYLHVYRSMK